MDKVSNGHFLDVGFDDLSLFLTCSLVDTERIREVDESMFGRRSQDAYQTGFGEEGS